MKRKVGEFDRERDKVGKGKVIGRGVSRERRQVMHNILPSSVLAKSGTEKGPYMSVA